MLADGIVLVAVARSAFEARANGGSPGRGVNEYLRVEEDGTRRSALEAAGR